LNNFLEQVDYTFISSLDVDIATVNFTDMLLQGAELFICQTKLECDVSSHPWLSDRCRVAIAKKHSLVNTEAYRSACLECSQILKDEFQSFVLTIKKKMQMLKRGSKEYWKLVKKLMLGTSHRLSVPCLLKDNIIARTGSEKASLFADSFKRKWQVPVILENCYTNDAPDAPPCAATLLQFRSRNAFYFLSTLEQDSATGPDAISTILLRHIAKTICFAFSLLARRIVECGKWPTCWKYHWIFPLFKKGLRSCCDNYRGLHLTSQLSKCMERFIGTHFMYRLSASFGDTQFAYRRFHGSRDSLTYVVLTWLLSFAYGKKVALYCSDVASAFDRVKTSLLLSKLRRMGIHPSILRVLQSWLSGRRAKVTVHGQTSDEFDLSDMTFQGTVWGPCLWNGFFADIVFPTRRCAFEEVIFADDLNAFRSFDNSVPLEFLLEQLKRCQDEVHLWGIANGVTFEQRKESFHVLSHVHFHGSPFRLLGVTFDLQLTMSDAIFECTHECHWRLSSILRARRYFSLTDLVLQYKSQVLSYLEYRTAAISHAADTHLYVLDSVQRRFLENVNLLPQTAFAKCNLAPLSCRRDIANLGVIYRAVIRRGPKLLWKFFTLDAGSRRTSPRFSFHKYQVRDRYRELHRDYINRSTLGYISVFNILPDCVFVMAGEKLPISVKDFQHNLTCLLRFVSSIDDNWHELFSPRMPLVGHLLHKYRNIDVLPEV